MVIKNKNLIISTFTIILSLTFLSCDDGWFSRKRWEGRRSSISIKDSKERKVFIRELQFETDKKLSFFLEKGYMWGIFLIKVQER